MRTPLILCTSIAILLSLDASAATTANFDTPGTPGIATQSGAAPNAAVISDGTNSFLRLINDAVNSQSNHYSFDATDFGGNWSTVTASYDFRMGGVGGNADGFSFLLVPTSTYGTTGIGPVGFTAEEPKETLINSPPKTE